MEDPHRSYRIFLVEHKDFVSNDNIFQKVSHLITYAIDNKMSVIPVIFAKDVNFINPLFFILLFSEKRDRKIKYAIDATQIKPFYQEEIQHYLRQKIDLNDMAIEAKNQNSPYYDIFLEENIESKFVQYKTKGIPKDTLFIDKDVSKIAIGFKDNKAYHFLPIMQLRGLPYLEPRREHRTLPDDIEPLERRKTYYSRVALQDENLNDIEEFQKFLNYTIKDFLSFIDLEIKNLDYPLGKIIFELIDNIRKHTDDSVNGYFSFSRKEKKDKNSRYNEYQIIIGDNGKKGILRTYRNELKKEYIKLVRAKIDRNLLNGYEETIKKLGKINNKENIAVLSDLYDLSKISQTHQIPRFAMHFGIPMLLKMMKIFDDKKSSKNLLEVFSHRDEHHYMIYYSGSANYKRPKSLNHSIKGSYIILTFTDRIERYEDDFQKDTTNTHNSSIKNQDYEFILKNSNNMQKKINMFRLITIKDLQDFDKIDHGEKIIINAEHIKKETFSDFIRAIYLYTYKFKTKNLVIINIDLDNLLPHLRLLAQIMYEDIDKKYDRPINILFYNKYTPGSIFIGGGSKEEFIRVADKLKEYYGNDVSLGLTDGDKNNHNDNIDFETPLFYPNKGFLLPFELFILTDIYLGKLDLLEVMLNNHLNKTARNDLHIDTHTGYHIDRFLEFKKVFEDSRWVRRLAFRLAKDLSNIDEEFKIIGVDKYTNMLISLAIQYLSRDIDYKLYNIFNENEYKLIKKVIEKEDTKIILVSSVIFKADKLQKLKKENITILPLIQLLLNEDKDFLGAGFDVLLKVSNNGKIYKIENNNYCEFCKKNRKIPLLSLSKKDPFFIEDNFFDNPSKKYSDSYCKMKEKGPNWFDSVYFGHIERSNNHFLYYINTVNFLYSNRELVLEFLKSTQEKLRNKIIGKNIIILSSSHDTNNNFLTLANKVIFDNEATILSFNKTRGESNFYDLETYDFDWENTMVYFVDDCIASGYTVEYFYQLFRSMPNTMKLKNTGLDGIIILVNRMSSHDETVLCSYIKTDQVFSNSEKAIESKLKKFYIFSSFEIKPIKTEVEKCFLCKRKRHYIKLMRNSSLDLTSHQMAFKAYKIKKISYEKQQKEKELYKKLKTLIKAMSTNYIHILYANAKEIEKFNFDKTLANFTTQMFDQAKNLDAFLKYTEDDLKNIIKFESEIALLKAMSFPKLSYHYNIKKSVIETILQKINKYLPRWNSDKKVFENFPSLESNILQISSKDKNDIFLTYYRKKTNFNKVNSYFTILGYFEDSKILEKDYIWLYLHMTQQNVEDKTLFHSYPFAVKITIDDNIEKANFFHKNMEEVYNDKIKDKTQIEYKKYSHFNALLLENRQYWINNMDKYPSFRETAGEDLQNRIKNIKKDLEKVLPADEIKMYITPNATSKKNYNDYVEYLERSEKDLIDIFNNFSNLDKEDKNLQDIIKMIFYGAIDIQTNKDQNVVLAKAAKNEIKNKINDTWANTRSGDFAIIRLVYKDKDALFRSINEEDVKNNKTLWFRPIGCLVVRKNNMNDYKTYMDIVQKSLVLSRDLTEFIVDKFSTGVIQEAIQKKVELDRKEAVAQLAIALQKINHDKEISVLEEDKTNIEKEISKKTRDFHLKFSNLSHDYGKNIRIKYAIEKLQEDSEFNEKRVIELVKDYTLGLQYIFNSSTISKGSNTERCNLIESLSYSLEGYKYESLEYELGHFISSIPYFRSKHDYKKQTFIFDGIGIDADENELEIPISRDNLKVIIFEIFFNGAKANREGNVNFKIMVKDGVLYLANNGEEIPDNIKDTIFKNKETINVHGNGLPAIKEFLEKFSMKIEILREKPDFLEEYKVIFSISKTEENNGN